MGGELNGAQHTVLNQSFLNRYSITFILICFFSYSIYSQTASLSGHVVNLDVEPINGAIITLSKEQAIIMYTTTEDTGYFLFENIPHGVYELKVSKLGYQAVRLEVNVIDTVSLSPISLALLSESLDEVTLEVEKEITIRKDTIIFNASSFIKENTRVVEDLLEQLPGIDVADDGTITVNGKAISRVLVEGDDLFGRGYSLLSKNLDAKAIDKVEVIKNYSPNPLFKDIKQGDERVINLVLDENKKFQWFGTAEAAYGVASENRYITGAVISNFSKKSKNFSSLGLNNLGVQKISDLENLTGTQNSDNYSNLGTDVSTTPFFSLSNVRPRLKASRQNINNEETVNTSSIFPINSKTQGKIVTYLSSDDKLFNQQSDNRFTLNETEFVNATGRRILSDVTDTFIRFNIDKEINTSSALEFETRFVSKNDQSREAAFFNSTDINAGLELRNTSLLNQLSYTNRFTGSDIVHGTLVYRNGLLDSNYRTDRLVFIDADQMSANEFNNDERTNDSFIGGEVSYLHKTNKNLLESQIAFSQRIETFENEIFRTGSSLSELSFFPNKETTYRTSALDLTSSYSYVSSRFSATASAIIRYKYDTRNDANRLERNTAFALLPELNFSWKFAAKQQVTGKYSKSLDSPSLRQIINNDVLTDFRTISRGLDRLTFLEEDSVFLNYSLGNWSDRFFFNTFFRYTFQNRYLSTNSLISLEQTDNIIIALNNRQGAIFNMSLDYYIKSLSLNAKLKGGYGTLQYDNIVNGFTRAIASENTNVGVELKSVFNSWFNFNGGFSLLDNRIQTGENLNNNTNLFAFMDVSATKDRWNLALQSEWYQFSTSGSQKNRFNFVDIFLNYKLPKSRTEISIIGNNLLNTDTFEEAFVGDALLSTTRYELIDRYFLLRLNFSF